MHPSIVDSHKKLLELGSSNVGCEVRLVAKGTEICDADKTNREMGETVYTSSGFGLPGLLYYIASIIAHASELARRVHVNVKKQLINFGYNYRLDIRRRWNICQKCLLRPLCIMCAKMESRHLIY